MAINKRLLVKPPSTGITPSEHFGVVLYEGDGTSSHSINGGKFGAGAYFNGSSSYVSVPISNSIQSTIDSISAWVRFNSIGTNQAITNLGDSTSDNSPIKLRLDGATNKIRLVATNSSKVGESIYSTTVVSANTWYHVAATWTGSSWKLYINGSNEATTSSTSSRISPTGNVVYIGQVYRSGYTNEHPLDGKIDQVRLFTKELSSSEVSTLYAETLATSTSLDPLSEDTTDTLQVLGDSSCIATYRFENNEDDLSGNYNGTGNTIQYAAGRYGQSAYFNGTDSYVSTGINHSNLSAISYSFWFKQTSSTPNSRIFGGVNSTKTHTGMFRVRTDTNVINYYSIGYTTYTWSQALTDNVWSYLTLTDDGTNVKLYLNGTEVTSPSTSSYTTEDNTNLQIGRGMQNTGSIGNYLEGYLDQVRIFNKALSASEVTTLYNENSLVASYRFEGNANDDTRNYDGTASNVTYEYGLNFTPDFVWIKNRVNTKNHLIQDSSRGVGSSLYPNLTYAGDASGNYYLSSFDTGGFTVNITGGDAMNVDGNDYVAWCLKANGGTTVTNTDGAVTSTLQVNQDAGFSIGTWTGTGVQNASIGHGLSQAPEIIIYRNRSAATNWDFMTTLIDGSYDFLYLNLTNAAGGAGETAPTDTLAYMWSGIGQNRLNDSYVGYFFHSVENFSSFGTYTGNGSTTGPIVETGFEPAFLMIKRTDTAGYNWQIWDNKRTPAGEKVLYPNLTNAESSYGYINFLSNGFQHTRTNAGINANGGTYIYMAFAADPDTEAPAVAKSFFATTYDGTGADGNSVGGFGFKPGLLWLKRRNSAADHWLFDIVRGPFKLIESSTTDVENNRTTSVASFDDDGFTIDNDTAYNNTTDDYIAWAWKADDNEPTLFGGNARAVYKFEDNVNDVGGNYNATATGITYTTGKYNKAADFDGSGDYVTISATATTPIDFSTENYTISHWVYPHNTSESAIYSSKWSTGATALRSYHFGHNASGNINISENPGGSFTSTGTVTQNAWNHVVYVRNATTAYIYINGSLDSTHSRTNTIDQAGTQNIYFGRVEGTASGSMYDGLMDQTRFFNKALTQENVTALYNETTADNDDLTLGSPKDILVSANANAGFSIVKYEGNGVSGTKVPHGLSAAPDMVIAKGISGTATSWWVQHTGLSSGYVLELNSTAAEANWSSPFNNTAASSTVVTLGNGDTNRSGETQILYCFHSVSGFSDIGVYQGNGVSVGPTITTGFQPDFVMIKNRSAVNDWLIYDSVRGGDVKVSPNTSNAEVTVNGVNFLSNGFSINGTDGALNAGTSNYYIYAAFKIN